MPKLVGFISHAFNDAYYDGGTKAFRAAVLELFDRVGTILSREALPLSVVPYFAGDRYGRELPRQLRNQIGASDFLIADLTAIEVEGRVVFNENVLFEVGFAMALGIPIFFVHNEASKTMPTDIRDILSAPYRRPAEIVALLEASLGQTLSSMISNAGPQTLRSDPRITQTWFRRDASAIHIICTPEPERSRFASQSDPNYLFVDNLEDRDALLEISTFLARQYPKANIIRHSSDTVPPDALVENLVVLGGPGFSGDEGNQITRELMSELNSKVRYVEEVDGLDYDGIRFQAELKADKSIKVDWGCLLAAQNPMNPSQRVIICHGIYTYGTLAAAMALSDAANVRPNHLILGDADVYDPHSGGHQFEALLRVPIVTNGRISVPKLQADLIRRL